MRNRNLQLALFLAAVGVVGAAGATEENPPGRAQKTVVVRYSESDLASDSGAEHLYSMLDWAARLVCDDSGYNSDLEVFGEIRRCEQAAIANAVYTVSSANLTSVYNRHYHDQPLVEKERLSQRLSSLIIPVLG